jgi:hypothetical protein
MKLPDEVRWLTGQWLAKADIDYRTAEALLRDEEPIPRVGRLPLSAGGGKVLEGIPCCAEIEFPKTHSIAQLLDFISAESPELAASLAETVRLTPFGVQIRYPGDLAELIPGQESEFFQLVGNTRQIVLGHLLPTQADEVDTTAEDATD